MTAENGKRPARRPLSWLDYIEAGVVIGSILLWWFNFYSDNVLLHSRVETLETTIKKDILPEAERKLSIHDARLGDVERRIERLENRAWPQ